MPSSSPSNFIKHNSISSLSHVSPPCSNGCVTSFIIPCSATSKVHSWCSLPVPSGRRQTLTPLQRKVSLKDPTHWSPLLLLELGSSHHTCLDSQSSLRLPSFGHLNGASIPSFQKFQFFPSFSFRQPFLSSSSVRSFRCSVRSIPPVGRFASSYRRSEAAIRFLRCNECLHNATGDSPVISLHFMQCMVFRQLYCANIHNRRLNSHGRSNEQLSAAPHKCLSRK